MLGKKPDQLLAAWKEYVYYQRSLPQIDSAIYNSWQRCRSYLNPHRKMARSHLSEDYLLTAQVASFDLLSVARPVMEDIYQNVEHTEIALVLVNSAGYILDMLSGAEGLECTERHGIEVGVQLSESQAGTNSFGLALIEKKPFQVIGAEHFLEQFHTLADAAAPLFDWNGSTMGALGMISLVESFNPYNLGLVTIGARAIRGQRQSDLLIEKQTSSLAGLNAVLATLDEGVLVFNSKDTLTYLNPTAEKLLHASISPLIGKRFETLNRWPNQLLEAVKRREPVSDLEIILPVGDESLKLQTSLQFVTNAQGAEWMVVVFQQGGTVPTSPDSSPILFDDQISIDDLLGESPGIRRTRRLASQAAAGRASILVRGQSGTGKNLLARAMHNTSPYRRGPFIVFPCTSLPAESMSEELVGIAPGVNRLRLEGRPGKFELAQGGTLYFPHVEALPLEAQAVLLNSLELGVIYRQGSDYPVRFTARVMASTSVNLEEWVAEGRFLSDLFYRLSAFQITIPTLQERRTDLPEIIDACLARLAHQNQPRYSLGTAVLDLLRNYTWPGNLLELEAVLTRAASQAEEGIVERRHLPICILNPHSVALPNPNFVVTYSLREIEENALVEAARHYNGNVTKMAQALGVGRTTVWRKLKEFSISLDEYRISSN